MKSMTKVVWALIGVGMGCGADWEDNENVGRDELGLDPTDSDGDGCSDEAELGISERDGGRRDPFNPYDWWDPDGNRAVNVFDILAVAQAFGSTTNPKYRRRLDRTSALPGQDLWDFRGPDGSVNVVADILGMARTFGHRCIGIPPRPPCGGIRRVSLDIHAIAVDQPNVNVPINSTVAWENHDGIAHDIEEGSPIDALTPIFQTPPFVTGEGEIDFCQQCDVTDVNGPQPWRCVPVPSTPVTYGYFCPIHYPLMSGYTLTVVP